MDKYKSRPPLLKPDQRQDWPPALTLWFMVFAAIPPALPYKHWVFPTMFKRLSMLIRENGISNNAINQFIFIMEMRVSLLRWEWNI